MRLPSSNDHMSPPSTRMTFGARSRHFAGTRSCHSSGGSFTWASAQSYIELQLLTVDGTIAALGPRLLWRGEPMALRRGLLPRVGRVTFYFRIVALGPAARGLQSRFCRRAAIGHAAPAA